MAVPTLADNPLLPVNLQDRIREAKMQNDALMMLMKELLQEGVDYGKEKGIKRPFLHQPGAQQLALVFRFAPKFIQTDSKIDFQMEPTFIAYEYKCELYHRDTGLFLGEGVGGANNYERKYRYRTDYVTGEKVDFEDPLDYQNTLLKMAKKRAYVDAVCNVTGASRLFASEEDIMEQYNEPKAKVTSEKNPGDTLAPFGKNKGLPLKELSTPDIQWLMGTAKGEKLKADCEAVLKQRLDQELTNEKIDTETGKGITEFINSKDDVTRKKARDLVQSYLAEKGFKGLSDIANLKKLEGMELLERLREEVENKVVA